MRSKQINFFTTVDDIKEIQNFLKEKNCLVIKNDSLTDKEILEYDIVTNLEKIYQVNLISEHFRNKVFFKHPDSKEYYYIDILKSFSIDFSLGGFYPYSNKELHSGRFYYISGYYENDKLIRKDEEFITWADDIMKSFKKRFLKKVPQYSNDFLSESVVVWIKMNNAKLTTDGTKFIV